MHFLIYAWHRETHPFPAPLQGLHSSKQARSSALFSTSLSKLARLVAETKAARPRTTQNKRYLI
jgi:hypothetical protein